MNFCLLPQILLKYDLTSAALLKHLPVQEERSGQHGRGSTQHIAQETAIVPNYICHLDFFPVILFYITADNAF